MDSGFLIIALVVTLPFMIIGAIISYQRRREHKAVLEALMLRVGLDAPTVNNVRSEFASKMGRRGSAWLDVQFKKAGIAKGKEVNRLITIQVVLLLLSLLVLVTFFDMLSENLVLLLVLLPFLPVAFVIFKIKKRQKELKQQFPEMLDSVVRSLQSGYGIDGALNSVGETMNGPLAEAG